MPTTSKIRLDIDGPIATITLNRPEKLNALDPEMLVDLEAAVAQLDDDRDVRILLLTGSGDRAFCVGADINAWADLEPLDMWRQWIRNGHRIFDRLAQLRQPVIAVLNGFTFGGGLELALAADLRIGVEGVQLALPEVKIGTIPGWAGTRRLPALIGTARAKQMVFTGGRIDAERALEWGLVNDIVPSDMLMDEALKLAREIAANAPLSVQLAKQAIDGAMGLSTNRTIEAFAGALAASTEDGQEGIASFQQRRPPEFRGS
jgi:enoyl-CoA hydratase/carnithine racemase